MLVPLLEQRTKIARFLIVTKINQHGNGKIAVENLSFCRNFPVG